MANKGKGIEEEIKGVEVKRNDSSLYMAQFQRQIIDLILDGCTKEEIEHYIEEEKKRIKTLPITDIAFPCKVGNKEDGYKNEPIFIRALRYTADLLPNFSKNIGELFYYIYVKPFGIEEKQSLRTVTKKGIKEKKLVTLKKSKDVMAFDEDQQSHIKEIDWDKMIERNIGNKIDTIFAAMGWADILIKEQEENEI